MTFQRKAGTFEEQLTRLEREHRAIWDTMWQVVHQVLEPIGPPGRFHTATVASRAGRASAALDQLENQLQDARQLLAKSVLIDQLEAHAVDDACTPEEALAFAQKALDLVWKPYWGEAPADALAFVAKRWHGRYDPPEPQAATA